MSSVARSVLLLCWFAGIGFWYFAATASADSNFGTRYNAKSGSYGARATFRKVGAVNPAFQRFIVNRVTVLSPPGQNGSGLAQHGSIRTNGYNLGFGGVNCGGADLSFQFSEFFDAGPSNYACNIFGGAGQVDGGDHRYTIQRNSALSGQNSWCAYQDGAQRGCRTLNFSFTNNVAIGGEVAAPAGVFPNVGSSNILVGADGSRFQRQTSPFGSYSDVASSAGVYLPTAGWSIGGFAIPFTVSRWTHNVSNRNSTPGSHCRSGRRRNRVCRVREHSFLDVAADFIVGPGHRGNSSRSRRDRRGVQSSPVSACRRCETWKCRGWPTVRRRAGCRDSRAADGRTMGRHDRGGHAGFAGNADHEREHSRQQD